jgi:hypothetical protein
VLIRDYSLAVSTARDAFERVEETRKKIAEFTLHPDEETGPDEQKTSIFGPTSTEMLTKGDKPDDVLNPPDGSIGGAEEEDKSAQDAREDQAEDESLPTCGKCQGRLSFPFWYCIFCKGWSQG